MKDKTFELHIPSNRKNIHLVEEFFHDANASLKLPDEKLHLLLVAVTEAVNNGIIHGNKNDETKDVTLTCGMRGKTLTVKIKDEGEGFDPAEIVSPLHDDNLLRTGGRGVFLMKSFMQSVKYNKKGNEVTLVMKL
ncbi:MAG: ATP-binding protein [Bacteroidota bacterium]